MSAEVGSVVYVANTGVGTFGEPYCYTQELVVLSALDGIGTLCRHKDYADFTPRVLRDGEFFATEAEAKASAAVALRELLAKIVAAFETKIGSLTSAS